MAKAFDRIMAGLQDIRDGNFTVVKPNFAVRVEYSAEDAGFIATVPSLPGCSAFGETEADARREIEIAKVLWIDAAQKAGNPVPPPTVS